MKPTNAPLNSTITATDQGLSARLGALAGAQNTKPNTMKKTIRIIRLALAALLFAASSQALLAAPPNTGVQGRAALYISYGTPVEVEPGTWVGVGDVMMPVATSFTVLSAHSGHVVGHFSTDADGAFTISLPPGKYTIVPNTLTLGGFPFATTLSTAPFEVTVRAKKFTYGLILYYQDGPLSVFSSTDRSPGMPGQPVAGAPSRLLSPL